AALCWGWIDGIRKSLDDRSFLQRLTPRGPKSSWSKINVDKVATLTAAGLMTAHGLKHVEAARADGRWDAAYRIKGAEVPADLQAAIDADPQARSTFAGLTAQNRFALIFRTEQMKTPAGRARKIADLTAMLARGETPHPQQAKP
ncbi:YdeI family protein, partial [Brevundimonas sp.]|uniref:YdeI/OmpD-associated family protein n=1 Tax=Brevundimonas sp. TaxID=1871086 RepID=UPI0037849EF2